MTVEEPINNTEEEECYDEDEDDEEEDDEEIIRMKWCADGSKTLDEVIEKLQNQIKYIQALKEDGYELTRVMDDDYGFIKKKVSVIAVQDEE